MNDDRDDIQAAPAPTYPPLPLPGEELFAQPDAQFEADFAEFFAEPLHDPAGEETKAARFDAILQRGEELILLEVKNSPPQGTKTKKTHPSCGSATAGQPNRRQRKAVCCRTRHTIAKPPARRRDGFSWGGRWSRPRFSPGRALARVGVLGGMAGFCVVTTVAVWSQNFSAFQHLVGIPLLVAGVSHHYLRSAGAEISLERENSSKTAMRMRSHRRNRDRV